MSGVKVPHVLCIQVFTSLYEGEGVGNLFHAWAGKPPPTFFKASRSDWPPITQLISVGRQPDTVQHDA